MIQLTDIHKQFGSQVVLKNVSLSIPDGASLCLIGRSGSGKSVLARLILGLETPDRGDIAIDGQSLLSLGPRQRNRLYEQFGVVFQGNALFDSLSIRENVGIKLDESGLDDAIVTARVLEALRQVGLDESVLHKMPAQLSGGMQKRVGIARAVVHQPHYLIYDEPTTGLDPINANRIDALIGTLARDPGRTSLIITHDLQSVRRLADHVAFLHEGNMFFVGTMEEFLADKSPEVREFLERDFC